MLKRQRSSSPETQNSEIVSDTETVSSQDQQSEEEIQVDFVFNAPSLDQDYHSIKNLLLQLFASEEDFDVVGMTENILSEGKRGFGTVVRCEADDPDDMLDPNAITAILELTGDWGKQISRLVKDKSKIQGEFLWFLHERVSNMPSEVAGPLCRIVGEEFNEKKFKQKQIVYICKKYKTVKYTSIEGVDADEQVPEYANEEDALMSELADLKFQYEIKDDKRHADSRASFYDGVGLKEYREILLFKPKTFLQALVEVQRFTDTPER